MLNKNIADLTVFLEMYCNYVEGKNSIKFKIS